MTKLSDKEKAQLVDNCRKATFLIEKQQTGKITLKEKIELEFHLKGCEICTIFAKQSAAINQFVKKIFHPEKNKLKLDDGFKEQLRKQIDEKLDKPSGEE